MATTTYVYGKFMNSLLDKKVDLDSDAIKVMLMASYTPAQDTHQYVSDVKAAGTEATGTGYTAGGKTVGTVTLGAISSGILPVTVADIVWASSSISAAYAVFYDSTHGSDATNPVIMYWDFGGTITTVNGPFTLDVNASGLFSMTRT